MCIMLICNSRVYIKCMNEQFFLVDDQYDWDKQMLTIIMTFSLFTLMNI